MANSTLVEYLGRALDRPGSAGGDGLPAWVQQLDLLNPTTPPEAVPNPGQPNYDTCVLCLTEACNLRCVYCYAQAGERSPQRMAWPIAAAAVDQVAASVRRVPGRGMTLAFHGGGEPTLNWRVLRQSVERAERVARRYGFPLEICGAFNACWPPSRLAYIMQRFSELSLSVDGTPDVQNRQRPTAAGGESFPIIARTLRKLDAAGFPYGLRVTVTAAGLDQVVEGVAYLCRHFRPHTIQLEPMFHQGRGAALPPVIEDPDTFIRQFIEADAVAETAGVRLFYSGARPDTLTDRFCLAPLRALVVTAAGQVTTCFEVIGNDHPRATDYLVGQYDGKGGFSIDSARLAVRLGDTVDTEPRCQACFCRWHCAGDCRVRPGEPALNGDPSPRCQVTRELTKYYLLKQIHSSETGWLWVGEQPWAVPPEPGGEVVEVHGHARFPTP